MTTIIKKILYVSTLALAFHIGATHAKNLTIFGPILGVEQKGMQPVFEGFEKKTDIHVVYTGSDSFEQQIRVNLAGGSAPNIALFPQPGLAANMAAAGYLTPLKGTSKWLIDNYAAGESWAKLVTYKGKDGKSHLYGFPFKVDLKSLVWYVPGNFEDAGYKVPKTMEELKALTKKIAKDGGKPWCIGLGAGAGTGWPATDWVEDIMLRTQSPQTYDDWVTNKIPFNDPKVVNAIKDFGWFAKNDAFVSGGVASVAATDYRDSPKGLFTSPPQCYMTKQASFISAYFPKGKKMGEDVDFFYFPAYASKPDLGKPILGGGVIWTITKDSEAAEQFIKYLETPEAHEAWMKSGQFFTPYKKANPKYFPNDWARKMNRIILDATTFRFDGSDQMTGAIGAGAFWTGMIDYVGGKSAKDVADAIQKSWDDLKKK